MTSYCISYDLYQPNKGREAKLLAALEVFEDRCHALNSIWFDCTPWTAEQIDAYLRRFLEPEDSLLVEPLPVGKGWSGWVGQEVRDWLLRHLGPSSWEARCRGRLVTGGTLTTPGLCRMPALIC